MKNGGVAVVALLGAVVGFVGATVFYGPKAPDAKLEAENADLKDQLQRAPGAATAARWPTLDTEQHVLKLETELASTKSALAVATKKNQELEALQAAAVAAAAKGDGGAAVVAPTKTPFNLKGYEEGLAEIDWNVIGSSMGHMLPLLVELGAGLSKGQAMEKMSPEMLGNIQRYNGPLVTAALKLQGKKGFGSDPNGAFSHPAFMVNAIAATLAAARLPLSAGQMSALEQVGKEYADAEARRIAGYDDRTYQLQKTCDEAELKDRFFEAAFAVLSQEQRDALSPLATRGRVQVDIFSSGIIWTGRMRPVLFHDRDALVAQMEGVVTGIMKLDDAKRLEARPIIADWANSLPKEWMEETADPLSRMGMVPASRAIDATKREVALLQRLVEALHLDAAAEGRARSNGAASVPIHVAE